MNVYELVEKMNGEICRGRARVRVDGKIIVIGQLNGDDMVFTEAGRQFAADKKDVEIAGVVAEATKGKRGRPAKGSVVESEALADDMFDIGEQGLT